jgi:hypothetical protein
MADDDDRLRLDYDQTTQLLRTLTDIRFKLLAFVPTVAGASVGLLGHPRPAAELLGVGLLGLVATLGIFVYELRNSQVYDAVVERAKALERKLGLPAVLGAEGTQGGLFSERPRRGLTLFGLLAVWHDRGLALVYGAALAGWSYLVAWGALRALDVGGARKVGAVVGAVVGLLVVAEVERLDRRSENAGADAGR